MTDRSARIDALRGGAIFAVLQYHYGQCFGFYSALGAPGWFVAVADTGWAGVDLFFVLSAFLLTRNLLAKRGAPGAAADFYRRRALRILPLYSFLLAAAAALILVLGTKEGQPGAWLFGGLAPAWTYVTFTQNFWYGLQPNWKGHFLAPTWSLAVEEHFYLLMPLVALRLDDRRLKKLALLFIVAGPAIRFGVLHASVATALAAKAWSFARVDCFGWGMLLALNLYREGDARKYFRRRATFFAVLLLVGLDLSSGRGTVALGYSLTALGAAALTRIAALSETPRRRAGSFLTAAGWMGERCYSIYLLHMPVAGLAALAIGQATPNYRDAGSFLGIIAALGATLILSELTYRYIEQPFLKQRGWMAGTRAIPDNDHLSAARGGESR